MILSSHDGIQRKISVGAAKLSGLVSSMISHCGSTTGMSSFVLNQMDGATLELVIDYLEHDFECGKAPAEQSRRNLRSESYTINRVIDDYKQDIKTFQKQNSLASIVGNDTWKFDFIKNLDYRTLNSLQYASKYMQILSLFNLVSMKQLLTVILVPGIGNRDGYEEKKNVTCDCSIEQCQVSRYLRCVIDKQNGRLFGNPENNIENEEFEDYNYVIKLELIDYVTLTLIVSYLKYCNGIVPIKFEQMRENLDDVDDGDYKLFRNILNYDDRSDAVNENVMNMLYKQLTDFIDGIGSNNSIFKKLEYASTVLDIPSLTNLVELKLYELNKNKTTISNGLVTNYSHQDGGIGTYSNVDLDIVNCQYTMVTLLSQDYQEFDISVEAARMSGLLELSKEAYKPEMSIDCVLKQCELFGVKQTIANKIKSYLNYGMDYKVDSGKCLLKFDCDSVLDELFDKWYTANHKIVNNLITTHCQKIAYLLKNVSNSRFNLNDIVKDKDILRLEKVYIGKIGQLKAKRMEADRDRDSVCAWSARGKGSGQTETKNNNDGGADGDSRDSVEVRYYDEEDDVDSEDENDGNEDLTENQKEEEKEEKFISNFMEYKGSGHTRTATTALATYTMDERAGVAHSELRGLGGLGGWIARGGGGHEWELESTRLDNDYSDTYSNYALYHTRDAKRKLTYSPFNLSEMIDSISEADVAVWFQWCLNNCVYDFGDELLTSQGKGKSNCKQMNLRFAVYNKNDNKRKPVLSFRLTFNNFSTRPYIGKHKQNETSSDGPKLNILVNEANMKCFGKSLIDNIENGLTYCNNMGIKMSSIVKITFENVLNEANTAWIPFAIEYINNKKIEKTNSCDQVWTEQLQRDDSRCSDYKQEEKDCVLPQEEKTKKENSKSTISDGHVLIQAQGQEKVEEALFWMVLNRQDSVFSMKKASFDIICDLLRNDLLHYATFSFEINSLTQWVYKSWVAKTLATLNDLIIHCQNLKIININSIDKLFESSLINQFLFDTLLNNTSILQLLVENENILTFNSKQSRFFDVLSKSQLNVLQRYQLWFEDALFRNELYRGITPYKLKNGAIYKPLVACSKYENIEMKRNSNDGVNTKCSQFKLCQKLREKIFASITNNVFDKNGHRCFCIKCHKSRKDKLVYSRGEPASKYVLPIGWCRFGMTLNPGLMQHNNVFEKWHVSFHGTKKEVITSIFQHQSLLKPGDTMIGGKTIKVRKGHITKSFERMNHFTGDKEHFDPSKQIFTSPSVKYASLKAYATPYYVQKDDQLKDGQCFKIQFAFQCRQDPKSYKIGHDTTRDFNINNDKHDPLISNNCLEWYTQSNQSVVLTGFLMKVEIIKRKTKEA